jgi:hypothetical protein
MISGFRREANEISARLSMTQRRLVVTDVSLQPICLISKVQVKMEPKVCPETLVPRYQSTPRNIPEERRSQTQTASMFSARFSTPA